MPDARPGVDGGQTNAISPTHIAGVSRRGRLPRRLACALLAAVAALALPAAARAAQPPTILSAGINGADQPYVTWTLGPGTTYDQAYFATAPDLEPDSPFMFDLDNILGFECEDVEDCPATPGATSYTMTSAVPRDRRYYAMVSAMAGTEQLRSAVWVIDEAKPQIAGELPEPVEGVLAAVASGLAAAGRLLPAQPVAPPPSKAIGAAAPTASIAPLKLPRKIGEVLRRGIRVTVACRPRCHVSARLLLGGKPLATRRLSPPGAGSVTFAVRPTGAARKRLRGRLRARLQIGVVVTPAGGAPKRLSRAFTVSR